MSTILEVDDSGTLHLPPAVLPVNTPHTRYVASVQGQQVLLSPAETHDPFWKRATTEQWIDSFNVWMASHKDGPGLSDEGVSRDSIYD